ncbi:restriction endonuclease subunit S [Mongoliitalea daihaiensis]|uniref:restriction endonuclease subunit S n=1 Tax=Mongoliitalea daihaiensis TaxID=2782006 RepID=UPI001F3F6AB4|nr:restriction endonuclease subunit S [Mongoliitalea daihaiensis]UJP63512.1 restriction endonuclease subunit S [Mongoliitalea daihaiensis]
MQLLEHFKELTLHPKNAEELKGLILQLAVQGKLTRQWREENVDVESASILLERINKEKERLIRENKIKKDKIYPKISKEEIPFNLPESWAWSRLGNYTHNFGQKTPDKEFEYIDVASIDNQFGVIKNELNILSPSDAPSRARKIVEKGCVIYSTVRPYLLNIAVVDREFSYKAIASTAFAILNPVLGCSEIYLYHVLRSYFFIEYVESCMKGVAYPAINDANLLVGLIPIPPLEEQKAIVEVVNQLFAEVEQLEELTKERIQLKSDFVTSTLNQLTQAAEQDTASQWIFLQQHFGTFFTEKENIKKLREGILQLAVQGKLTRDWRTHRQTQGLPIEHASTLLEKIKAEKEQLIKEKKIKKEKPLPEISEEEIPYELPEGWVWCRWVDLLGCVNYPMKRGPFGSSLRKDDFVEIGIRVFEQYNPINDDPHWMRYFITEEKYESMKGFTAKAGDFLISCSGATLGRIVYLPKGTVTGIINQALLKLTLNRDLILAEYFLKLFRSKYIQELIWQKAQGMAQPNMVGVKELKNILIPLPPLDEQKAIVEKVNALMALCDKLEQEIDTHQTTEEEWMQSCLRGVVER